MIRGPAGVGSGSTRWLILHAPDEDLSQPAVLAGWSGTLRVGVGGWAGRRGSTFLERGPEKARTGLTPRRGLLTVERESSRH